ncbi:MAG: recombinase family protein [Bdellovibrionaceae bacterium]|nr:recombinase family protein [Pseudobdellovibrionaceae bacterium]
MTKKSLKQKKSAHKIALYIRVSTEEQASNPEGSIKSQEQRLRHHVQFRNFEEHWGEVVDVYIDRAKSGKDTNRPQLQRLLKSIVKGDISLVMVTELSRLSRNIKDFCEIWDLMREHDCEFQSLREQFDTTSAAGEMVLMTLANIAQFERKQVSERVRYNFRARAERGLFNGGSIPWGYKKSEEKRGHLEIAEDEAEIVREAYATFIREQTLNAAGKILASKGYQLNRTFRKNGVPQRNGKFTIEILYRMLTNRAYIGLKTVRNSDGEEEFFKAVWPAIISESDFEKVQGMLKSNRFKARSRLDERFPFLLSGLCVCGTCNQSLVGKSAHGNSGKVPYYEHSWATKKQGFLNKKIFTCQPHRILANRVEPIVLEKVMGMLTRPEAIRKIVERANELHVANPSLKEEESLSKHAKAISKQMEALAEHLSKLPKGVSPDPIYAQMQKLEGLKNEAEANLAEVRARGIVNDLPVTFQSYESFCKTLKGILSKEQNSDLRNQVIRRLVKKVEVLPQSFKIHYFVGQENVDKGHENLKRFQEVTKEQNKRAEADNSASAFFSFNGSNRLTIGWGRRT